jgi:hypothetical protein
MALPVCKLEKRHQSHFVDKKAGSLQMDHFDLTQGMARRKVPTHLIMKNYTSMKLPAEAVFFLQFNR